MACLPTEEWEPVALFRATKPTTTGPSLVTLYSTATGSRLALDLRDRAGVRTQETAVLRYTPLKVGTSLAISIDGGPEQVIRLFGAAEPGGRLAELVVRGDGPMATMSIRVAAGTLALQGIVLPPGNPEAPAIDVFGLRSATVHGWSNADPKVIQAALSGIQYDTVILAYGTNEGAGSLYHRDAYLKDLRRAAANFRAVFPTQGCLMAGPPDRGVTRPTDGTAAPQALFYASRHREISRAQEQVAKEFRCQFWDWQADMGGPGSSYAWARMTPPLMQADLSHLTGYGYRRSGLALARALKLSRAL
jgi:lysophospholipase L1-like esterase